jgi:hypothetical protein
MNPPQHCRDPPTHTRPSSPPTNAQGVGEFQCYDRRALASLAAAAREHGEPEWGNTGEAGMCVCVCGGGGAKAAAC